MASSGTTISRRRRRHQRVFRQAVCRLEAGEWFTVRSSGYYSDRRYDNYNYNANVATFNFPPRRHRRRKLVRQSAYRQMMTDNRERWKANVAVDIVVLPGVTVTPNFKYQDDNYGLDGRTNSG